jgi:hypothetical protein
MRWRTRWRTTEVETVPFRKERSASKARTEETNKMKAKVPIEILAEEARQGGGAIALPLFGMFRTFIRPSSPTPGPAHRANSDW